MNTTSTRTGSVVDPLINNIRGGIKSGNLKPGKLIASEYELANKTGISRGSVRRAIGQLVDEGLIERRPGKGIFVREQHVRTRSICLMVADLAYSTWALSAQAIQKYGREEGINVSVFDIHVEVKQDLDILEHLPIDDFQGAIISFLADRRILEAVYKMRLQQIPFTLIGGNIVDPDIMVVGNNNFEDGRTVGKKLIEHGHRRIGYFGLPDVVERLHGIRAAMDEAGILFDPKLAIDMGQLKIGSDWSEAISNSINHLLNQKSPPTAIFAGDDGAAAITLRLLRRKGLSIPKDISVVGLGGETYTRLLDPPLATVAFPLDEIAKIAVNMVISRIINPNCTAYRQFIPGTWIDGESIKSLV